MQGCVQLVAPASRTFFPPNRPAIILRTGPDQIRAADNFLFICAFEIIHLFFSLRVPGGWYSRLGYLYSESEGTRYIHGSRREGVVESFSSSVEPEVT
jgi:hypothetical protein